MYCGQHLNDYIQVDKKGVKMFLSFCIKILNNLQYISIFLLGTTTRLPRRSVRQKEERKEEGNAEREGGQQIN